MGVISDQGFELEEVDVLGYTFKVKNKLILSAGDSVLFLHRLSGCLLATNAQQDQYISAHERQHAITHETSLMLNSELSGVLRSDRFLAQQPEIHAIKFCTDILHTSRTLEAIAKHNAQPFPTSGISNSRLHRNTSHT